jgi:carbonic anhydrase
MSKNIKLHYIIQHQPSFLYSGSLTYPECQDAIWLLFSQYHLISETDYTRLVSVIQRRTSIIDATTRHNNRNLFATLPETEVYRNWNELSMLTPKPNLLAYNSASYVHINFVILISLFLLLLMI